MGDMTSESTAELSAAAADFHRARRQADIEGLLAALTGRKTDLLSYDDVRSKLRGMEKSRETLQEVPLDAIIGSLGRYSDFTRSFLPKKDSDRHRWAKIMAATRGARGLPPVELYKVGEAYFVRDGHHRVSVVREMGARTIQAYVTEVSTKVPLTAQDELEDVILKAEYTDFLERSGFGDLLPGSDFMLTVPRRYGELEEQVRSHQRNLSREQGREVPHGEAVLDWFARVYSPVVEAIRERGVMRDFPDRTETDLYLWIFEHRGELEREVEREVNPGAAALDLIQKRSPRPKRILDRLGARVRSALTPAVLESGPSPGRWREERGSPRREDLLFADILVPLSGDERSWMALDQAALIAVREGARLYGLHALPEGGAPEEGDCQAFRSRFEDHCREAGIEGGLHFVSGAVAAAICDRARWNDLIVLQISYPPPAEPLSRMGSGLRNVIRRCPRPVLTVPARPSQMGQLLLAYDSSPKAREALYVATYFSRGWGSQLTVLHVDENGRAKRDALAEARAYIESHSLSAIYESKEGEAGEAILSLAASRNCDLILMGGYGSSPAVELVIGSAVDQVLRESEIPVLICR
jgi:nucleotide-binding universal stress UspA family protein